MGKSLYIQQLAMKLKQYIKSNEIYYVTIPLHGPVVTADKVLELLKELLKDHTKRPTSCIYHFEIAQNVRYVQM